MTNETKKPRLTASVRFRDRPRERKAKEVFERYAERPDPEDPKSGKKMRPQQILIEALISLGEKDESPVVVPQPIEDALTKFRQQVAEGLLHINITLRDVEERIQKLAKDGTLTEDQVKRVGEVFDAQAITNEFAKNVQSDFRPGRKKRNG